MTKILITILLLLVAVPAFAYTVDVETPDGIITYVYPDSDGLGNFSIWEFHRNPAPGACITENIIWLLSPYQLGITVTTCNYPATPENQNINGCLHGQYHSEVSANGFTTCWPAYIPTWAEVCRWSKIYDPLNAPPTCNVGE